MSNAKRIQKKVLIIQMKQFRNMLQHISKIDTRPLVSALNKMGETLTEIANIANIIKIKNEQL